MAKTDKTLQEQLTGAHATIQQGQATGNQSTVDAGMAAQSQILKDNGIVYPTGNKGAGVDTSTTPLPKSWGGTGIISGGGSYSAAAKGSGEGDALASALKSLYSSNGLYASALAAQQKANQANVDKAVSTLEGQKNTTTQSYADMFRQLYQQKMNARKNIGQQMAAQGMTGGASESTLLGLETDYSEAMRRGLQGRTDTLGELDRAITAAKLDGDIANAQLAADSAREQTAGYASVLQGLLNRYDNQQAQQTAYEREDAANKLSYARQLAISIAQGGNMPTDDLLTAAGMTRADAEAIVASVAGANAASRKPLLTAAQTLSALESGIVNDSTLAAYEYWYGQSWPQISNVVDAGPSGGGKGYDNEGLKPDQVRAMQAYYGLTTDGMWGPSSQSTTKMGAQAAWKAYQTAINGGVGPAVPETSSAIYTTSGKQVDRAVVDYFNELLEGGITPENLTRIVAGWVDSGYRGMTEEDADALFDTVKNWGR